MDLQSSPSKASGLPRPSKLPTVLPSSRLPAPSILPKPTDDSRPRSAASVAPKTIGLTSPTRFATSRPPLSTSVRRVSGIASAAVLSGRPSSSLATRASSPTKAISPSKVPPPLTRQSTTNSSSHNRSKSVQAPSPSKANYVRPSSRPRISPPGSFSQLSPPTGSSPIVIHATPQPRRVTPPSQVGRSSSQVPSTPATVRRTSAVLSPISPKHISPVRPPPRPTSALSLPKRPGSSLGLTPKQMTPRLMPSPQKKGIAPPSALRHTASTNTRPGVARRSISAGLPRSTIPSTPRASVTTPQTRTKSATPQLQALRSQKTPPGSNTSTNILAGPGTARRPAVKNTRAASSGLLAVSDLGEVIEEEVTVSPSRYRKAIEEAKAASGIGTARYEYDLFRDPFNKRPKGVDDRVVSQLIRSARSDGKLNLTNLSLDGIPDAVLKMYDSASMAQDHVSWNDISDLTVFNAADNRFTELSPEAFPDVDPYEAMNDDAMNVSIFAALQKMDLRGNELMNIPPGFRFLTRLTTLNLSRNQLGNSALDIIIQITTLRELNLADNGISGFLPKSIGALQDLETLDIRNNKILHIPSTIGEMKKLRVLIASGNQLTGLPMDALESLPITELNISSNALVGALFPFSVHGLAHIEDLNVSNNSLASLAFSENLALPNVRILKIANNRIVSLPDMSSWQELVTLAAGGNKISEIPHGFVSLRRIRHADFSSNDLTRLDERISAMDSLESLLIGANPLVDRKLLTMGADGIKRNLRMKMVDTPPPSQRQSMTSFGNETSDLRSPEPASSPYKMSPNGALDLANKGLTNDDADGLRGLLGIHDVRELQLSRNKITIIPYELSLAQHLRVLDLSMCELGEDFACEPLVLPALEQLQLSGNKITTLSTLQTNMHAPYLRFLDVSNNHIDGDLLVLRSTFECLEELHVTDNRIKSISSAALLGLFTVTLARNDITTLPADIGLLWFQGLRHLDVSGNTFRAPNQAVLDSGTETTLAWLREKIPGYAGDDETF